MTFVNLSLLAGTALVALPIVLHLMMRRRPTLLEFPALRFLEKRHDVNQRRLQLRHWLLLLLRAAAIALLAFALARPSVKLGIAGGSQEAPVAAALVFDAAPRMEYRHENQTRLEAARNLGLWLLSQLPEQSQIAVLDTRLGATPAFQADSGVARDLIARLETAANSQSLPAAIGAAVKLLKQSDLPHKEIYVFTDLSRGGWPAEQAAALQESLKQLDDLGVYVIDVGVADPKNFGLGELRLSGEVLPEGGTLVIATDLSCLGAAAPRVVELHLLNADRVPEKKAQQSCDPAPGELRPVELRTGGLDAGTHQGFVRIVGQDGLAADDVRYFTVAVKPAQRVLIVAPNPPKSEPLYLAEALAPAGFRRLGQAKYASDVCEPGELAARELSDYAVVYLLDPPPLEPAAWKKLADFAAEGHGVGIALGRNAQPIDSFNAPQAQELLPGKLLRQALGTDGDLHLAPRDYEHPILAPLKPYAGSIPWPESPVFRYWELEDMSAGAATVIPYNDGRPALIERPVGRGRALILTTPLSDRPSRNPWNLLPIGWPFVALVDQMTSYLTGSADQHLNYPAGQTAVLRLDAAAERQGFLLTAPGGLQLPIPADLNRRELTVTATDQVGNYRLQAGGGRAGAEGPVNLGFSVNYAPAQTMLERLTDAELAATFGPVKHRLARTREQIDRDVSLGRVGRELFPSIILIVALVLGLEWLVANRFYRE